MTTPEENPIVFFDITMGGQQIGRIKMELFRNVVPKTADNFKYVCIHIVETESTIECKITVIDYFLIIPPYMISYPSHL